MGLTMSQRRAVTKTIATRYRRADKAAKLSEQYDELTWRARLLGLVAHANEGVR